MRSARVTHILKIAFFTAVAAGMTACSVNGNVLSSLAGLAKVYVGYAGTGADGALVVTSANNWTSPKVINSVSTYVNADSAAGATSVTVKAGDGSNFTVGDQVVLITMLGTGVGQYEVANISATTANTLTFSSSLNNAYTHFVAGTSTTQIVQVAQYSSVTVNSGGFLTVPSFSTSTGIGGVMYMRVTGTLTVNDNGGAGINGVISVAGSGYAGGTAGSAGVGPYGGAAGANGGTNGGSISRFPSSILAGSGGGSSTGTGGPGGGIMIVDVGGTAVIEGSLDATGCVDSLTTLGATGSNRCIPASTSAGGGAGGSIYLTAFNFTSGTRTKVYASGGAGAGTGTAGGDGLTSLWYNVTGPGVGGVTATPSATNTPYLLISQ